MKGLVYKDLSLIGRQGKFLFVYLLVFVLIFSAVGDGASTVTSFLSVVCFMLSINCFAYDEQCGFGKLVAASPLRPLRVALSGKASTPGGATELASLLGKEESIARVRKGIELLSK